MPLFESRLLFVGGSLVPLGSSLVPLVLLLGFSWVLLVPLGHPFVSSWVSLGSS